MSQLIFAPLLSWPVIWLALAALVLGCTLALWRGLPGWALRALAGLIVVLALANPIITQEERKALTDIVLLLEDKTASAKLADRAAQSDQAAQALATAIERLNNTELRRITVQDSENDGGTALMGALQDALAKEPSSRIAGVIALSDGRVHDMRRAPELPAPFHLVQTGQQSDWDRRLVITGAPGFGIIGEPVSLTMRIEDQGAHAQDETTRVTTSINGAKPVSHTLPIGEDIEITITLPHSGMNVIEITVPEAEGELTTRNNSALIQMNGIRERLRVMLVSGEPHPGTRTWRNLLKSDSSVDLVHFTILRPPEKQGIIRRDELSLIAFPTRELFLEKIDEFDLIIFDRYKRRGLLAPAYLDNVRAYAERGGAVLFAAGPDFASADSLYRSPLGQIVPAVPTARVIDEAYRPKVTELGARHPVTADLDGADSWGQWLRHIEVEPRTGQVLMSGPKEKPLLVVNRVGQGRVALLASDHAHLWARGYDGGGPQMELLRRLAHWMMKEPELEEEALTATAIGQQMHITRRTMGEAVPALEIITPEGNTETLEMRQIRPGLYQAEYTGAQLGLYHLTNGEVDAVIGLGPAAPREFEQTIATSDVLAPLINVHNGGVARLEDGIPLVRAVRKGRPASGPGWIGITPRGAYETTNLRQITLLPPWLILLLAAGFTLSAWLYEGRR